MDINEHSSDEEVAEHVDEKWLVSYADMMTLLFGLFVMLFSIASEKQGNFNETLKEVARVAVGAPPEETASPAAPLAEVKPEQPPPEKASLSVTEDPTIKERAQEAAMKALQEDLAKLQEEAKVLSQEKKLLQEKTQQIEDEAQALREIEKVQKEQIASLEKKAQEVKPAVAVPTSPPVLDTSADKLKKLQKEIDQLKLDNSKLTKQAQSVSLDAKIAEQLESKNADLEAQLSKLKNSIKSMEQEKAQRHKFVMIVLKWTSDKHDLDLTVTDPKGRLYNFKNRKHAGAVGEFTLDSRGGPGAEIWRADNPVAGEYKVSWKLYNSYGNTGDVVYSLLVSSGNKQIQMPETKMPAKVGSSGQMSFKVDTEGNVEKI